MTLLSSISDNTPKTADFLLSSNRIIKISTIAFSWSSLNLYLPTTVRTILSPHLCHPTYSYVTSPLSPHRCHLTFITSPLSPRYVTLSLSPHPCQITVVTSSLSPHRCRPTFVTSTLPPHLCHVTFHRQSCAFKTAIRVSARYSFSVAQLIFCASTTKDLRHFYTFVLDKLKLHFTCIIIIYRIWFYLFL